MLPNPLRSRPMVFPPGTSRAPLTMGTLGCSEPGRASCGTSRRPHTGAAVHAYTPMYIYTHVRTPTCIPTRVHTRTAPRRTPDYADQPTEVSELEGARARLGYDEHTVLPDTLIGQTALLPRLYRVILAIIDCQIAVFSLRQGCQNGQYGQNC